MKLNTFQQKLNRESPYDFSGLKAIFLNCTLKKSPELSHTEGLIRMSQAIMAANKIATEIIRPVDHRIAFGVYPDMTKNGWDVDEWPPIQKKIRPENDFTNRNTTFMTWNLMHQAHLLHKHGIPAYGNQRTAWDDRKTKDNPNPEYR